MFLAPVAPAVVVGAATGTRGPSAAGYRQRESSSLARAGLGARQNVLPSRINGMALACIGVGSLVTSGVNRIQERLY